MMDMFMDKLAQKLNAQEIIKANSAAETEELNKLRSRVAEYNECLDKLEALIESASTKLDGEQADNRELQNLVGEIYSSVLALQNLSEENSDDINAIAQNVEELMKESLEKITAMQKGVESIVTSSDDNVHKECVKVYRNVQAVVVEEGAKQAENLEMVTAKVNSVKSKVNVVLGISIVTLILSLGSVVMQVLGLLN